MEETRKRALEMDVFTSSRPASLPESAVDPDEAHNYFDTIAYNKGIGFYFKVLEDVMADSREAAIFKIKSRF